MIMLGPILGLLGSLFTSGTRIFEKKIDYQHELNLYKAQAELKVIEMENEAKIAEGQAASAAFQASYQHDTDYGKPSRRVADILRFIRPAFTFLLMALVAAIYFTSAEFDMREAITLSTLDYAGMALSWWFGSRTIESSSKGK